MVEKGIYIPNRGDLVWVNLNPQAGREQKNKRPALVLSPRIYNEKTSLALFCPLTSQIKKYPFEVKFTGLKIKALYYRIRLEAWIGRLEKLDLLKKLRQI